MSSKSSKKSRPRGVIHNLHLPEVVVYVVGALVPVVKWFLDGRPREMVATDSVWLFFVCQGVVTVFTMVMSMLLRPVVVVIEVEYVLVEVVRRMHAMVMTTTG